MANSISQIHNIPLEKANLNLNKFDSNIKQFNGFNKLNSPFFGDKLSPMWKKERTAQSNGSVFDNDGNEYYFYSSFLMRKNLADTEEALNRISQFGIVKTQLYPQKYLDVIAVDIDTGYFLTYGDQRIAGMQKYVCLGVPDQSNMRRMIAEYDIKPKADFKTFYTNEYPENAGIAVMFDDGHFYVYKGAGSAYPAEGIISESPDQKPPYNKISILKLETSSRIDFYFFADGGIQAGHIYVDVESGTITEGGYIQHITIDGTNYDVKYMNIMNDYFIMYQAPGNKPVLIKIENGAFVVVNAGSYGYPDFTNNQFVEYAGDLSSAWEKINVTRSMNFNIIKRVFGGVGDGKHLTGSYVLDNTNVLQMAGMEIDNDDNLKYSGGLKHYLTSSSYKYQSSKETPINGVFSVLINNEHISGIGFDYNEKKDMGALCTEWNSIDEDFKIKVLGNSELLIYRDKDGLIWMLSLSSVEGRKTKRIGDWIVYGMGAAINSKTLKDDRFYRCTNNCGFIGWLDDVTGWTAAKGIIVAEKADITDFATYKTNAYTFYFASGLNVNYEITKGNPTLTLNPILYHSVIDVINKYVCNKVNFLSGFTKADIYISESTELPKYKHTVQVPGIGSTAAQILINSDLVDIKYPVDTSGNVLYTPSCFSKIIDSYFNKDLILEGSNGYPLIYYNNKRILGFYMLSVFEKLSDAFIINGQSYAVMDDKIFSCSYQNGVISNIDCVANVSNMKFLGSDTHKAFFWADMNKTVYTFSGSNILDPAFTADSISSIEFTGYNPTTNSIYVITNDAVYVFGQNGSYTIFEGVVKKAYMWNKGLILQNGVNILYSFTKLEGFEKQNIKLATEFFGLSSNQKSINDCVYLRIFDDDRASGNIKLKVESLTDGARETEETIIRIDSAMWDKLTNSIYLRYQPKKQRALGTSVFVESPFAIGYMGIGNTPDAKVIDSVSKNSVNKPEVTAAKYNF